MQSVSFDVARASSDKLQGLVQQILNENQEMRKRLQSIEIQARSTHVLNDVDEENIDDSLDDDNLTVRPNTPKASEDQGFIETRTFTFTFDDDLRNSRVYKRSASKRPKSSFSLPSSQAPSLSWSFFSELSLSKISNVSILSLPISETELFSPLNYSGLKNEKPGSGLTSSFPSSLPINRDYKTVHIELHGSRSWGKTTVAQQFDIIYEGSYVDKNLTRFELIDREGIEITDVGDISDNIIGVIYTIDLVEWHQGFRHIEQLCEELTVLQNYQSLMTRKPIFVFLIFTKLDRLEEMKPFFNRVVLVMNRRYVTSIFQSKNDISAILVDTFFVNTTDTKTMARCFDRMFSFLQSHHDLTRRSSCETRGNLSL